MTKIALLIATLSTSLFLSGCDYFQPKPADKSLSATNIVKLIPNRGQQKAAWASDIAAIFDQLNIERSPQNLCSAIAIIDQESNFNADPAVPNLGKSSLKQLDVELDQKIGTTLAPYFRQMLTNEPTPQNSFEKQILKVKTERQLDEIYHQMFAYFSDKYYASKITNITSLLGEDVTERLDPITTLGSMQVSINYARDHQRQNGSNEALRQDLYSQYGGLYYGIHRLLIYPTDYKEPIYRFADYNSGMYSSRNAAFQKMLSELTKQPIDLDGDLLIYKSGMARTRSQAETAINSLAQQGLLTLTPRQIHSDLLKEKRPDFVQTASYQAIANLYHMRTGKAPLTAVMPQVVIAGAKLNREYNTKWYADKVNQRYLTCLQKAER